MRDESETDFLSFTKHFYSFLSLCARHRSKAGEYDRSSASRSYSLAEKRQRTDMLSAVFKVSDMRVKLRGGGWGGSGGW